jgi:chromosome segregation ATPase|nr:MAG TPA: outer capsid protein sigma-1 attachment protein [Caudoviricetes sp.]
MSINVKKYTKDQMAKMVEEAQAEVQELKRVNVALNEQISQMNGEAITRENVIANLKADADALRNKLADTEAALWRANAELGAAEGALREMNDKIVRCEAYSRTLRRDVNKMQLEKIGAIMRADYAEAHPWRNLWAWVKRKLVRHE